MQPYRDLVPIPCAQAIATAAALAAVGALLTPLPALAAPAPCDQAERYAAQSGSQILLLNAPGADPLRLGDSASAMIAQAPVNAAAVARLANRGPSAPLVQQAPPGQEKPATRTVPPSAVDEHGIGTTTLTTRAHWDPRFACAAADGEITKASTSLGDLGSPLLSVRGNPESRSTTALRGDSTAVATATLTPGDISLLDDAVHVSIVRGPTLRARMSTKDGGKVTYSPAVIEVTGPGHGPTRLTTPGDHLDLTIPASPPALPPDPDPAGPSTFDGSAAPDGSAGSSLGSVRGGAGAWDVAALPASLASDREEALPLPEVPGLPRVDAPATESAPAAGPGTRVRVLLGAPRQATDGRAIAARATALTITVVQKPGDGYAKPRTTTVSLGTLEAAAVAPEPGSLPAGQADAVPGDRPSPGGTTGGLPITGPATATIASTGLAMILTGAAALFLTRRRKRTP
jgi:LPXTG-motif cell wall-anchored protein